MEHIFLTYDEAAARLGIKSDSVRRRARSRKWPRRQGNNGKTQVGIPPDLLGADGSHGDPPGPPPDNEKEHLEVQVRLAVAEARLADVTAERDRLAALLEKALEPRPSIIARIFGR